MPAVRADESRHRDVNHQLVLSPAAEWKALTDPNADEKVREAMRQSYAEQVLPKFVKRYGLSYPTPEPCLFRVFCV